MKVKIYVGNERSFTVGQDRTSFPAHPSKKRGVKVKTRRRVRRKVGGGGVVRGTTF